MSAQERAEQVSFLRRRCRNREMQALLIRAVRDPALLKVRQTSSGILLTGPYGSASTHYTSSDFRAVKNFRARLRQIGLVSRKDL